MTCKVFYVNRNFASSVDVADFSDSYLHYRDMQRPDALTAFRIPVKVVGADQVLPVNTALVGTICGNNPRKLHTGIFNFLVFRVFWQKNRVQMLMCSDTVFCTHHCLKEIQNRLKKRVFVPRFASSWNCLDLFTST